MGVPPRSPVGAVLIQSIVFWSLHNRLIVILGALALVGIGLHSASELNVEAYPDPTPPLVEVISQSPGASPEEMERLVGIPLETALNGMPGLVDLRSTSIAGSTTSSVVLPTAPTTRPRGRRC